MPSTRVEDLPRLPQDADGPVFAEPWQAQRFRVNLYGCTKRTASHGANGPQHWPPNCAGRRNAANQTMTRHTTTSTGLPRWRVC